MDYAPPDISHSPEDIHKLWKGKKKMKPMSGVDALPRRMPVKAKSGIHIKKSHQGLLHKNLGVPAGEKIPASKIAAAKNSPSPAVRKRATFAANAAKWHH